MDIVAIADPSFAQDDKYKASHDDTSTNRSGMMAMKLSKTKLWILSIIVGIGILALVISVIVLSSSRNSNGDAAIGSTGTSNAADNEAMPSQPTVYPVVQPTRPPLMEQPTDATVVMIDSPPNSTVETPIHQSNGPTMIPTGRPTIKPTRNPTRLPTPINKQFLF